MDEHGTARCATCGRAVHADAVSCSACGAQTSPAASLAQAGTGSTFADDFPPSVSLQIRDELPPLPEPPPLGSRLPAASVADDGPEAYEPPPPPDDGALWAGFAAPATPISPAAPPPLVTPPTPALCRRHRRRR